MNSGYTTDELALLVEPEDTHMALTLIALVGVFFLWTVLVIVVIKRCCIRRHTYAKDLARINKRLWAR